jgi:hypothetical protein
MGIYKGPPSKQRNPRAINAYQPPLPRPPRSYMPRAPKPLLVQMPRPFVPRAPKPYVLHTPRPFVPRPPRPYVVFDHLRVHNHYHNGLRHAGDRVRTPDFCIRHQFGPSGEIIGGRPKINPLFIKKRRY